MRTTVTLDPDTEQIIRRRMRESGMTFKQVLNDAVRNSVTRGSSSETFRTRPVSMGQPTVNLDRALQIAGQLEDDELIRKMRTGL